MKVLSEKRPSTKFEGFLTSLFDQKHSWEMTFTEKC